MQRYLRSLLPHGGNFLLVDMKKRPNFQNGFTLIEMLIVVSVISILAAVVLFSAIWPMMKRGRDARRLGDMKTFQDALEQCYSLSDSVYPSTFNIVNDSTLTCGNVRVMDKVPRDPFSPSGTNYQATITAASYCICAKLEIPKTTGNSDASCNFGASNAYYCVKNKQ